MAKVIIFSRKFPAYHPKVGKQTFFVEQFLKQRGVNYSCDNYIQKLCGLNTVNMAKGKLSFEDIESFALSLQKKDDEKSHTIRGGNRFKTGEIFSPRCWFGKPYNTPKIIFWDDTEVKKTWKFEADKEGVFSLNGKYVDATSSLWNGTTIAENDGLSSDDFLDWFPVGKELDGQIICWNEDIKY